MESETSQKIKQTVTDILKSSDLDTITEKHVRDFAAVKLNIDLSDLPNKILVRHIVESFLLDQHDDVLVADNGQNGHFNLPQQVQLQVGVENKPVVADSSRVICKLSQRRDVAVRSTEGKTVVSIREFFMKDGKQLFTSKGITLHADQWSAFSKSVPEIEEAIAKVESRLRSQVENSQVHAHKSENVRHENGVRQFTAEPMQKLGTHPNSRSMENGKQVSNESSLSSTHKLLPIEIVRFDGKNYRQWADHMESYLNHLKVGYVLSVPCPSAARVADWELAETLSTVEKWIDDDHICRQNMINTLCDNMYSHYSKKAGSARDLWEELKLIYLYEEHGAKVSLVKKYIEFQIVEEKSVFDQVQELHHIADSLIASGMYVEEKFHVNVIISKLPPSWKPFSIDLMKEDHLAVWMLMNELKAEEESRQKGNKNEARRPRHVSPGVQSLRKLGPQRIPMKRPGIPNYEVDREKTVKFCSICKKNGHHPEQCWFRNSSCRDVKIEPDNVISDNVDAEGVKDGAAGKSNS